VAETDLVREALEALFAPVTPGRTLASEADGIDRNAWQALREFGLAGHVAVEMPLEVQAEAMRAQGYAAALTPLIDGEMIARWLAAAAGFATDEDEILTAAICEMQQDGGLSLEGVTFPFGRHARRAVLSFSSDAGHHVALVSCADLDLRADINLAGEPRDHAGIDVLRPEPAAVRNVSNVFAPAAVMRRGAFCRAASMLGAASRIQDLAVDYAGERTQFGRPLGKFQVIQSYLAEIAAEVAAASAMFESAIGAMRDEADESPSAVAATKVRAGLMARRVTSLAHQIHGAMGFTREYPLHLWTRRLWAWRDEYGSEATWAEALGREMIAIGGDGFWNFIAR
jgi:acyl-CoA dehydrogenase